MDESIVRIVDCMVYAQSDLFTAEQGIQALKGRDYTQVQMTIAAKGINDAIKKLQTALSIINDGPKITQETVAGIGSNNHDGDNHILSVRDTTATTTVPHTTQYIEL